MYTVCPKCALTLVVTAADLRVAQGFVRCGRCSNVFNALARLSEDRNAVAEGVASATLSQPIPPPPAEESREESPPESQAPAPEPPGASDDESIPETALEFNPAATDVTKVFVEQTPDPQWSAATGKFKALIRKAQSAAQGAPKQVASPRPASPQIATPKAVTPRAAPGAAHIATPAPARQTIAAPSAAANAASSDAAPTGASPTAPSPTVASSTSASPAVSTSQAAAPTQPAAPNQAAPQAAAVTPAASPSDADSQFDIDIEIDAAFLAAATQIKPQLAPVAQTKREPAAAPAQPRVETRPPVRPAALQPDAPRPTPQDVGIERADFVAATHPTSAVSAEEEGDRTDRRPRLAHLWSAGTGALAILLVAQIVHHYRHDLAANQSLYKPLTSLYSALGIPLVPRWNLGAYDVRQLGASADNANAGQITVRASVKNTAKQAQPLPLLRVTLQDRFGNRIAARDVPPQSYLPRAIPASSFLSAGQRIDAEMAFVDPGSNAVGFEIDACLPAPGGSIACANDAGAR